MRSHAAAYGIVAVTTALFFGTPALSGAGTSEVLTCENAYIPMETVNLVDADGTNYGSVCQVRFCTPDSDPNQGNTQGARLCIPCNNTPWNDPSHQAVGKITTPEGKTAYDANPSPGSGVCPAKLGSCNATTGNCDSRSDWYQPIFGRQYKGFATFPQPTATYYSGSAACLSTSDVTSWGLDATVAVSPRMFGDYSTWGQGVPTTTTSATS
ncbi:MAG: hypothetical protein HC897_04310 [Thermoanaerobaculia bacterium]|nr:hypothetical protein [Thermoanaerobaculia bacterium]